MKTNQIARYAMIGVWSLCIINFILIFLTQQGIFPADTIFFSNEYGESVSFGVSPINWLLVGLSLCFSITLLVVFSTKRLGSMLITASVIFLLIALWNGYRLFEIFQISDFEQARVYSDMNQLSFWITTVANVIAVILLVVKTSMGFVPKIFNFISYAIISCDFIISNIIGNITLTRIIILVILLTSLTVCLTSKSNSSQEP